MTGKLIRFEFRSTGRLMAGLYIALILLSIINRITTEIGLMNYNYDAPANFVSLYAVLLMIMYIICAVSTFVFTMVMIVFRFWQNLLENQGYLMHTLPVRTRDHVISKLSVSLVWTIVSFVVFIISIWILAWKNENVGYVDPGITEALSHLFSARGGALCFVLAIVIVIVDILGKILKLYAAMSIGQTFKEHRIIGSIGMYIALSIVESIFEMTIVSILGMPLNNNLQQWTDSLFPMADGHLANMYGVALIEGVGLIIPVVYFIVYFFLTNHFLGKKLNLL